MSETTDKPLGFREWREWQYIDGEWLVTVYTKDIERLMAEWDKLAAAVDATYDMLDGIYGADRGEKIPYFTLTSDRKAACDKARKLVHAAIPLVISRRKKP